MVCRRVKWEEKAPKKRDEKVKKKKEIFLVCGKFLLDNEKFKTIETISEWSEQSEFTLNLHSCVLSAVNS